MPAINVNRFKTLFCSELLSQSDPFQKGQLCELRGLVLALSRASHQPGDHSADMSPHPSGLSLFDQDHSVP
ncbi:hypothetical protein [Microvirga ossetica]|uniref:hypothetical protein n=1 Tax=Microvirga ossetica TaxID=1882682 RepID=UPI0012FFDC6B|nr:hypothetical protein [Microvirga ossetica]